MRPVLLLSFGMLAACGQAPQSGGEISANQVERLSRPREVVADPKASVRLAILAPEDVAQEQSAADACRFTRNGQLMLIASGQGATVRVGGQLRHLLGSASLEASGGYFEDRQISVSVGRTSAVGAPTPAGMSWPGRIAVTNRRNGVQAQLRGSWTCRV